MGTLYELLGVSPTAPLSEIRTAYREKARRLHPDVSGGSSAEMAAVNEAWAILSDKARRASYDARARAGQVGEDRPSAEDQHITPRGNSVATRFGQLLMVTVLSLVFLLAVLLVYAFTRSGIVMAR